MKKWGLILLYIGSYKIAAAQSLAINNSGATAHSSALLDMSSINKGMLTPRMTLAQRNAIPSPATGLLVFVTDVTPQRFYYYNGTIWVDLVSAASNTWQLSGADIYNTNTGNVIIDNNVSLNHPLAKFQVNNGNVFFTKAGSAVSAPTMLTSYSGRRMAWYADQAAFRMGYYDFNIWNSSVIGLHSFAGGNNCSASGDRSFSYGSINSSMGSRSVTMGGGDTASGDYAAAFNINNHAVANFSTCFGSNNYSKYEGGLVLGTYNDTVGLMNPADWMTKNRVFQIGNGISSSSRSNAMTVLQNGNIGMGTTSPESLLHLKTTDWTKAIFENDASQARGYIGTDNNGTITYGANMYWDGSAWQYPVTGSSMAMLMHRLNNQIEFRVRPNAGALTTAMVIEVGGNVGIGNTAPAERLDVTGNGRLSGNLIVQNNKGIIRNIDGTQSKKLSTTATVNTTFTAGQTQTFTLSWPETFSATPEAYVANATGVGGWAEVVISIANVTTTGATLYVYNPRSVSASPNFTIRVVAIGAQ